MGIDSRAGIAVPIPATAQIGTSLEQANLEAFLAQAVKLIDAVESRSNNECIQYFSVVTFLRLAGLYPTHGDRFPSYPQHAALTGYIPPPQ